MTKLRKQSNKSSNFQSTTSDAVFGTFKEFTDARKTWDACIVGTSISAAWLAQLLVNKNYNVLWIKSGMTPTSSFAFFNHAWNWYASPQQQQWVNENIFQADSNASYEAKEQAVYFDAKNRVFKSVVDSKIEYGIHEKAFYDSLSDSMSSEHATLQVAHDQFIQHLKNLPQLTILEDIPLTKIDVGSGVVSSISIGVLYEGQTHETSIEAKNYFFSDYEDGYYSLMANEAESKAMQQAFRFSGMFSGFGLEFQHKELSQALDQKMVIPLLVNPTDKEKASHLFGEFSVDHSSSYWIGFLTSEELEDNNEILKKMKTAKRAIDRAIPGFIDSIAKEQLFFQQKLWSKTERSQKNKPVLGAYVVSDFSGPDACIEFLQFIDKQIPSIELQPLEEAQGAKEVEGHTYVFRSDPL